MSAEMVRLVIADLLLCAAALIALDIWREARYARDAAARVARMMREWRL